MKKAMRLALPALAVGVIVFCALALIMPDTAVAAKGGKGGGGGGGGGAACCDPALQPGVGGNPLCFEGATCCSDGNWRCNNPDGSPSCTVGKVCG